MTIMTIHADAQTDLPPLRWGSIVPAYQWAVETASRPNYRSPAAVMAHSMVGRIIGSNVSGWRPDDYRDLAHSILTCIANIDEPLARETFRYIYGADSDRLQSLGGVIGEMLHEKHGKKTYGQMRRISETALFRARISAQGRRWLGMSWYAKALGIQRPSLYSGGWQAVIADAESIVSITASRGQMLARDAVGKLGVIG